MPIYTYYCKNCKQTFDTIHGMNESLDKCEKCNSKRIERQVSKGACVIFKGEGWTKNNV